MLKIWVKGFRDDCIKDPNGHFDMYKEKDWFNTQEVKDIIKEIDDSIAVKDEYIESPVYGGMAPERLSSGCKCLILLSVNPTCNVYASRCGDNCSSRLLKMAEDKDVIITLHHIMEFYPDDFTVQFLDSGKITHTWEEYVDEFLTIEGYL